MNSLEIRIQICPNEEDMAKVFAEHGVKEKIAVYIDKNRSVWGLGEELAIKALDSFEDRSKSEMIGKTDYIIIYDADSEMKIGEKSYILGDCLIMKSESGLKCMTEEEVEEARQAFRSRLEVINVGPYQVSAYKLA